MVTVSIGTLSPVGQSSRPLSSLNPGQDFIWPVAISKKEIINLSVPVVQLREAAQHPNWSLTPAVNGGTKGEAPTPHMCVCLCVYPPLHVSNRAVTDGEGKEENPIRNSIKNRFMEKHSCRDERKEGGHDCWFVCPYIVGNLSISMRG